MMDSCEFFRGGHLHAAMVRLVQLALLLALFAGCQHAAEDPTRAPVRIERDNWEAYYLQGSKIGYGRTTIQTVQRDGQELLETRAVNHLEITRFGQTSTQQVVMTSFETRQGQLLEFETQVAFGSAPTIVRGRVENGMLTITAATQGREESGRIEWPAGTRGFRGIEQSLLDQPPQPGEQRTFKMLVPIVNQVADVELHAKDHELTSVLGTQTRLLRVDSRAKLPGGQSIDTILWIDSQGEVIKTEVAALQQESFRATEKIAKAPATAPASVDLGLDLFVKVEPPIERPHESSQLVYRVELADGDPAEVFAQGITQSVRSLGAHVAEVTVRSGKDLLTDDPAPVTNLGDQPGEEYLEANSVLQLDDPRLREMAGEARGDRRRPKELALGLERYVHGAVTQKDFSQGFATAAEVAETRTGDCTEHAVLLAALARICDLPSRVAIGLVYVEGGGGFGYHMWTEIYLDGRWIPFDGIMGTGGTSAAYLKLNDSSLAGASVYGSFLSVAQVLGQLKISVVSRQ